MNPTLCILYMINHYIACQLSEIENSESACKDILWSLTCTVRHSHARRFINKGSVTNSNCASNQTLQWFNLQHKLVREVGVSCAWAPHLLPGGSLDLSTLPLGWGLRSPQEVQCRLRLPPLALRQQEAGSLRHETHEQQHGGRRHGAGHR